MSAINRKRKREDEEDNQDSNENDNVLTKRSRFEDEKKVIPQISGKPGTKTTNFSCPYLSNEDSKKKYLKLEMLDFDFEKICSKTLSYSNVYCCLKTGKFLQGKGLGTPAYLHSLENDAHLFLNLESSAFWCLPENYQIPIE